jgi:hypothetical protein
VIVDEWIDTRAAPVLATTVERMAGKEKEKDKKKLSRTKKNLAAVRSTVPIESHFILYLFNGYQASFVGRKIPSPPSWLPLFPRTRELVALPRLVACMSL